MKVSSLSELLGHFSKGIESAGGATVAKELTQLAVAIQPFAERTVADFISFLGQCEEYQRTGAISGGRKGGDKASPASDPDRVSRVNAELKELLEEASRHEVAESRIDAAVVSLDSLTKTDIDEIAKELGITPKPKSKPDGIRRIRQTIQLQAELSARAALT